MSKDYEQMELDTRKELDKAVSELAVETISTVQEMIQRCGEAPAPVRNRHEAYGIAAEHLFLRGKSDIGVMSVVSIPPHHGRDVFKSVKRSGGFFGITVFPDDHPFHAFAGTEPEGRVDAGVVVPGKHVVTFAFQVVTDDLDGKVVQFPVGDEDRACRLEEDGIDGLAGDGIHHAPGRIDRRPSFPAFMERHEAGMAVESLCDAQKTVPRAARE